MSLITENAYNAFVNRRKFNSLNTKVTIEDGEVVMYVFGNKIAKTDCGETYVSDGGYSATKTTRERLNAFPEVYLSIKKGEWIANGKKPWNGKWTNINNFEEI